MLCLLVRFAHIFSGLFIQVLLLVIMTGQTFGTAYFVNSNAPPGGNGTSWYSAWQNFQQVNNTNLSGIVYVAPGYYTGADNQVSLINRSDLTIKLAVPSVYVSEQSQVYLDGQNNYNYGVFISGSSDIIIQEITTSNFIRNGIRISDAEDIYIWGCRADHTLGDDTVPEWSFAGIFAERSDNVTVKECKVTQSFKPGTPTPFPYQTEGIYAQACDNLKIIKNYIHLDHYILTTPEFKQPHIDGIQVTWENPDYSSGVEISDNIIINLGKDTQNPLPQPYNHYRSGIALARTNGNILIKNNNIVVPYGKDLINAQFHSQTENLKIYNNTLVSTENPTTQIEISNGGDPKDPNDPPDPGYPDRVRIKNNIFVKKGTGNRPALIIFNRINPSEINRNIIDYNLYYYYNGSTSYTVKLYFSIDNSMRDWNYYDPLAVGVIGKDPEFVPTAEQDYKYFILYDSPAKNMGVALPEVTTDLTGSSRPYWEDDYDIGAYEIEDTQLKLGAGGVGSLDEVIHTVTAFGNFWERNPDGTFFMSENYELQSATETSIGNFDEFNLYEFPGMEYGWLDRSNNSSGKKIAAGFYRVTNDLDPTKFMYVDLRDEVDNYSLNVYLRYKYDLNPALSRFQYYDPSPAVKDFVDLNDYQYPVVTIWQINHFDLQNSPFWEDGVVVVKSPANHPLVCWLPFGTGNIYTVERSSNCVNPNDWAVVGSTTNEFLEDTGLEFCTAVPPATCFECTYNYRVKQSTSTTYPASVSLVGTGQVEKYAASNSDMGLIFSLEQNYPNPFNPVTNIRYSLPEDELLTLKIYDILGREVLTLVNERKTAGKYEVKFDGSSLSSGIYICQLSTEKYRTSKKIHLIK